MEAHSILLMVHKNLFQRDDGATPFRTGLVHLTTTSISFGSEIPIQTTVGSNSGTSNVKIYTCVTIRAETHIRRPRNWAQTSHYRSRRWWIMHTQMYPLQAFPGTRTLVYLSIHEIVVVHERHALEELLKRTREAVKPF